MGKLYRPQQKRLFRHLSKIKEFHPKIYIPSMIVFLLRITVKKCEVLLHLKPSEAIFYLCMLILHTEICKNKIKIRERLFTFISANISQY